MKGFQKTIFLLLFIAFGSSLTAQRINPATQIKQAPGANYVLLSDGSSNYNPVLASTLATLLPDDVLSGTAVPTAAPTGLQGNIYVRTTTGVSYVWNGASWVAQQRQLEVYNLSTVNPLPSPVSPLGSIALKAVDVNGSKTLYVSNGTVWLEGGQFLDTLNVQTINLGNGVVTGAKIAQAGATPGQVLQWTGTTWSPANVSGAGGVSDGNKVDITVSGSGSTYTINSGAVTGAKIAQAGATSGQVLAWNGTTWAPATVSGGVSDGNKGDITVSSSGTVYTINAAAVTMAKIAQAGASSGQVIKWNGTAWAPAADATSGSSITSYSAGSGAIVTATGAGVTFVRTTASLWTFTVPSGVELLSFDINSTSGQSATSALDIDFVFAGTRAYNQDATDAMTDGKVPIITTLKKITPATYPSTAAGNNVAFTADVTTAGTLRISTSEFAEIGGGGAQPTSVKGAF